MKLVVINAAAGVLGSFSFVGTLNYQGCDCLTHDFCIVIN